MEAPVSRLGAGQSRRVDTIDLSNFPAIGVAAELVGLRVAISAPTIQRIAHFADLPGAAFGQLQRRQGGNSHCSTFRCRRAIQMAVVFSFAAEFGHRESSRSALCLRLAA